MLYFVVNPHAKSKYGWRIWKKIEKELNKRQQPYRCYITKRPKEAIVYGKKLTVGQEQRHIVILGGDGTLNEFLNGMTRAEGICLSYLPIGSGNDFARGMKISSDYKKELKKILDGGTRQMVDYGIYTNGDGKKIRFFISAGMGYDAEVCHKVELAPMKKLLNRCGLGKLSYLVIGVAYLLRAKTFSGQLVIDGKEVLHGDGILFISVHNQPFEGGGLYFCPNADSGDGYLDVCAAKGLPKWKIPFIIPMAYAGKHVGKKGVYQFSGKKIEAVLEEKQYLHTDGEPRKQEKAVKMEISREKIAFLR